MRAAKHYGYKDMSTDSLKVVATHLLASQWSTINNDVDMNLITQVDTALDELYVRGYEAKPTASGFVVEPIPREVMA